MEIKVKVEHQTFAPLGAITSAILGFPQTKNPHSKELFGVEHCTSCKKDLRKPSSLCEKNYWHNL